MKNYVDGNGKLFCLKERANQFIKIFALNLYDCENAMTDFLDVGIQSKNISILFFDDVPNLKELCRMISDVLDGGELLYFTLPFLQDAIGWNLYKLVRACEPSNVIVLEDSYLDFVKNFS